MIRIEKLLSVAQLNVSRLSCLCTARCFKESRTHDGQSLYELPPHYKGPLFIGKKDIRYTANAYRRAVKVLAKKSAMIQMIIHRIAYEEVVLHIWVYLPYLLGR